MSSNNNESTGTGFESAAAVSSGPTPYRWTRIPRPDHHQGPSGGAGTGTDNAVVSPVGSSNRKRDRYDGRGDSYDDYRPYPDEDVSCGRPGASYASLGSSSCGGGHRPTKRRRQTGPDLVAFDAPFPCAFRPCRYRATCTYHHGVPIPCDCDDAGCPRGHAHRRRPQACDHGATHQCRWNRMRECSFHHGIEESCDCDDVDCRRAHPRRTKKNREVRQQIRKEAKRKKERKAKRKKERKDNKGKSHYTQWRDAQETGETNVEKRRRYLELYPDRRRAVDGDDIKVKEEQP